MANVTKLIYLEHNTQLHATARVLEYLHNENNTSTLILDQTVFYPQGGGQPYDQGIITNTNESIFTVEEVRFQDGVVSHIGTTKIDFKPGDTVSLQVDSTRRIFNSRNHTAGHLVDLALSNLGYNLIPGKGYHFPEGSYVEYLTPVEDEEERKELKTKLQTELDSLVKNNLPITLKLATIEELKQICTYVPDYLPKDKPSRVMLVEGYPGFPCGGTHASSTGEVGKIRIEKLRNKKGCLRVSYSMVD